MSKSNSPMRIGWFSRLLSFIVGTSAVGVFLLPYNFVALARPLSLASQGLLVLGGTAAAFLIFFEGGRIQKRVAVVSLVVVAIPSLIFWDPTGAFFAVIPLWIGLAAARGVHTSAFAIGVFFSTVVLAVELLAGQHLYSLLVGTPLTPAFEGVGFRARGIFGHALPAAVLTVAFAMALPFTRRSGNPRVILVFSAVAVLAVLVATGTRSGLVILLVGLAMALSSWLLGRLRSGNWRVSPYLPSLLLLGIAAGTFGIFVLGEELGGLRFFDFAGLSGSYSSIVRSSGFDVLASLPNVCGWPCDIVGHGGRNLQELLSSGAGIAGISTIDNQFLTLFWDYGLVSLVAISALLLMLLRAFFAPTTASTVRGFALIGILVVTSGFFYDALYVAPSLLALGIACGKVDANFSPWGKK